MSQGINLWLKNRLDRLVSVQNTYPGGQWADLIIQSWSGVRVYLHLVKEPLKTRTLKKMLQDATSIGTSSLFLVDAQLFPADGERFELKEWLQALQLLTHEYIYAYRIVDRQLEVFQVHFEHVNNGMGEHKVWYGPEVPFDRMRHYRTSVKPRFLRGDWMVADFDTPPFWRNTDYRAYRTKRDNAYAGARKTRWETWSGYQQTWTGMPNDSASRSPGAIQTHLEKCYEFLGVSKTDNKEVIKSAFRKRAMSLHPDTSELPDEEAEIQFRKLNEAYEYIKAANGWS